MVYLSRFGCCNRTFTRTVETSCRIGSFHQALPYFGAGWSEYYTCCVDDLLRGVLVGWWVWECFIWLSSLLLIIFGWNTQA